MRENVHCMTARAFGNKPAQVFCLFAVCITFFLTACSTTGHHDDAANFLDSELAASVLHLQGNERPEELNRLVKPGTVVVWLNKSSDDIRILFPERKVTIACLNPVSFSIDAEGFFESKILLPGAVASLCFIQPGLYAYIVERQVDDRSGYAEGLRLEGTIVVE